MPEYEITVDEHGYVNWNDLIPSGLEGTWRQSLRLIPELSPQRKLLRDRVKLIRAMQCSDHLTISKSATEYDTLMGLATIIREDKDNHFLSYSQDDPRMISYSSKSQHKYDNDKRYKTTLGRYIRKQLKIDSDTISDRTLENLAYNLFGELTEPDDLPIEVITGHDITEAYYNEVGGNTCMCDENSGYTIIYEMNPDKVSMVVYDGKARALLWTTDEGVKILDRIYPNDGSHTRAMKKWAISKGYLVRDNNGCADCDCSRLLDNQYYVTLKHNDVFPYMDTFMHGQINDDTIVVSNLKMDSDDVILQGQDGSYHTGIMCCHCDESIHEDEAYNVDGNCYCEDCYSDLFTQCDRCSSEVDRDNTYLVDGENNWCEYCATEHAQECHGCSEIYTDCLYAEDTDRYYCQRCSEDLATCEICDTIVEEYIIGDDDRARCANCHTSYEESKVESTSVA